MRFACMLRFAALLALGLVVSLGCGDDGNGVNPDNNPPVIYSLTAEPDTFYADQSTVAAVVTDDPDGDECTCAWEVHGIEMMPIGGTDTSVTLQPGCDCLEEPTDAWILVIVSDGQGGSARDSVAIRVEPLPIP